MVKRVSLGRTKTEKKKKSYSKASDDEKVARNWTKALGLYEREEWSVAILRCATCLELMVNFAIRQELVTEKKLPLQFVDKLLQNANGIHNKYQNLYLPIMAQYEEHDDLKRLWNQRIVKVNAERNKIAHQGEFRNCQAARTVLQDTSFTLREVMGLYGYGDELAPFVDPEDSE
ncbi:hypothetical protein [Shinella granuli]|uniref:Apea-like HEPN domain-containing protein n=1 Tax=Shinella granuli TaxID=323621 RepID=A0A4R2BR10_SHIGR|nr:hypothetical protein [Shinella granuli]TCN30078.1 hypothetical protein EV665_1683 [Shinella granuli]